MDTVANMVQVFVFYNNLSLSICIHIVWCNILSLCCRHHSTKMQSEMLRSVDQGIPQHEKPFHTQWIAQVREIRHFKITVQVQHLCPLPDRLLPHLFVQGWAGVPGAPLSPSTSSDKEGNCLHVINVFLYTFRQVGPTTCPGPGQLYCLNPLSGCLLFMANLFVVSIININSLSLSL